MTITKKGDQVGGILIYFLMSWFAWHTFVICVTPMFGLPSSVLHLIFGEWPEVPYVYLGGLFTCIFLLISMIKGKTRWACTSIMFYACGMAAISSIAFTTRFFQIALLYGGFSIIAIVCAASMKAGSNTYHE